MTSCAEEASFNGTRQRMVKKKNMDAEVAPDIEEEVELEPEPEPEPEPEIDPPEILKLEIEKNLAPPIDYLFIIDNSESMSGSNGMMANIRKGFRDIVENGEFLAGSRIGVISMAVDEVDHEDSKKVGFKRLANKYQIARSSRSNENKKKFPGCESGWFAPEARDAKGNYCLVSATNFKLKPTTFEAGLSSFDNFIKEGHDRFRENALVNVVFFSDTHDTGFKVTNSTGNSKRQKAEQLESRRDSYSQGYFLDQIALNTNIRSLKFHGMVPVEGRGACGERNDIFSYTNFIEESNGEIAHCKGESYSKFISRMLTKSKYDIKSYKLDKDVLERISKVKIDGKNYRFDINLEDSELIILDVIQFSTKSQKVEIILD